MYFAPTCCIVLALLRLYFTGPFCLLLNKVVVEAMERALEVASAKSPLKATVESVLPGVQQRFTDVQNQLKQLQHTISMRPWMEHKSLTLLAALAIL
jgi:hypothetical protein